MCGFTANLALDGVRSRDAFKDDSVRMTAALRHRGPDAEGFWFDYEHGLALGHRRLSILDLSEAGHQPMVSADGRYVIAFNGEIYNFSQLRRELEAASSAPAWRGHSDTEVLLAAIAAWGVEATLRRLIGMFAFALWDRDHRCLVLARDRIGEKPLYYGRLGGHFVVASELKALRAHQAWDRDIDPGSVALFLRHGYVPTPYSIYHGIYKLTPGCYMEVYPERELRSEAKPVAYWSAREVVERPPFAQSELDPAGATDHLDRLLRASVQRQMVADVPIGAFLSGGIDSSMVVSLMQAQSPAPVRTFTIGFHEQGFDEAPQAKEVARHLGTQHTELYVTPCEAMEVIPSLPTVYDEPFADASQIPTYLVSKLARTQVTVALSGDGGDELFGGYTRYAIGKALWRQARWMPHGMRRRATEWIHAIAPSRIDRAFASLWPLLPERIRFAHAGDKLHKMADLMDTSVPEDMYQRLVSYWRHPGPVVAGGSEHRTVMSDPNQWPALDDFTERMMYFDLVAYLPDDILVKVDRAAMAVSLETRMPLLDHRVVEFAWQLPLSMKIHAGQGKWLLRQVLQRYIPRALIDRPKKGFVVPIDAWLRGPLREWAEPLLSVSRLKATGMLDHDAIRAKWQEHLSGTRNWQYLLWAVLMLQAWLEDAESISPASRHAEIASSP
jgi:asparagine synthase (glutamine-hydrolysing)